MNVDQLRRRLALASDESLAIALDCNLFNHFDPVSFCPSCYCFASIRRRSSSHSLARGPRA